MKSRKLRRIWGKPWDFAYLLELEQYKIREMRDYMQKHHHLMGWQLVIRDMNICLKLIDIILEKDQYYRSWLDNCYGSKPHKQLPFPVYVNSKNYKRFMPLLEKFDYDNIHLQAGMNISLRQRKALYLYNKIRAYRMECWWD